MYLSSNIFKGSIVFGKNTAFDKGNIEILLGKLFLDISKYNKNYNYLYNKIELI